MNLTDRLIDEIQYRTVRAYHALGLGFSKVKDTHFDRWIQAQKAYDLSRENSSRFGEEFDRLVGSQGFLPASSENLRNHFYSDGIRLKIDIEEGGLDEASNP